MPLRPRLAASRGDDDDAEQAAERAVVGAAALGMQQDPDWADNFMRLIMEKDYDSAREVLRRSIACGIQHNLAEQYAKVLEEFLQRRDELERPPECSVVATRGSRVVLADKADGRGRGLSVPGYRSWGDVLWNERPLAVIQSPCSRKCVQVCRACLSPVGTLATQLAYLGVDPPQGAELIPVQRPSARAGAAEAPAAAAGIVRCTGRGCSDVFCSAPCRDWGLESSSHSVLCVGRLPPNCYTALQRLEKLAEESETEHLLLLAHSVAEMLLLRRSGELLEDVLQRHARQFASAPWDSLAGAGESTDPSDTAESRRGLLARAAVLLREVFAFEDADLVSPLLDDSLLSGLLGSYELVNMCICLPHPLNANAEQICDLLQGTGVLPRIAEMQTAAEPDDESDADGAEEEGGDDEQTFTEEEAVEAARSGTLFADVLGSALVETLAYTNHSCLPNCNIDFATPGEENAGGPGLWVQGVARRPLLPGDEVLMAYVPSVVGRPFEVRQRRMRKFGFTCRCRSCLTDEMLASEDIPIPPMPPPG